MKREIKFRAWGGLPNQMIENVPTGTIYIFGKKGEPIHASGCIFMQYTGLLDKNGKEIYESDYLGGLVRGLVEWTGSGFYIARHIPIYDLSQKFSDVEIIGNIYENSELLSG